VPAIAHPVLIVGAGIAGLAAAIAMSAKGFAVRVLEKRTEFSDVGAGIQIGPNGVKALAALGLRAAVEAVAFRPEGIAIHAGRSGRRLTTLPLGAAIEGRHGAPYVTLLRADLQSLLRDAARAAPGISIETGYDLVGIEDDTHGIEIRSSDGRSVTGTALIGADGLWSRVRAWQGAAVPAPTGYAAFRALIPQQAGADAPQASDDARNVDLWLGRSAHVVCYPVARGAMLNVVVIVRAPPGPEDWDRPGQLADITPHLADWSPGLLLLLRQAPHWRRWTVFAGDAGDAWAKGRTLRIGDAAHPILPFLAQGAVMALEDAVVLADTLAASPTDPTAAFARFEARRRPRVARVTAASARNGEVYHLLGVAGITRDAVLRLTPTARLLGQYVWLYGHDVT
jgi:salicylate hydroxylase